EAAARALVRGRAVEPLAVETHRAGLVAQRAADAIDQRALARGVGSDQADALPRGHGERDFVQRDEAAEALAQPLDLEELAHGTVTVRLTARPPARRFRPCGGRRNPQACAGRIAAPARRCRWVR